MKPIALLLLLAFAGCSKTPKMTSTPEDHEFAQSLLTPNWQLVETHFNSQIPQILKDYYSDPRAILQDNFDLKIPKEVEGYSTIHVEFFTPIDESSIGHFEGFERFLDIASDGGEGIYFIDPKEDDAEVFLFVMDGHDLHPTGLRLSEFLKNPRLEPTDYWDE